MLNKAIIFIVGIMFSVAALSEVAVIVHKGNADEMDSNLLKMIFLGKVKSFPSVGRAIPLDLPEGHQSRVMFFKAVIKKTESQYTSYWAAQMFTGNGVPPKLVTDEAAVVKLVSDNPNTIGFVDASQVSDQVRVVATF
jgi:ABC-type phosphate transport system substrate-binding protein